MLLLESPFTVAVLD